MDRRAALSTLVTLPILAGSARAFGASGIRVGELTEPFRREPGRCTIWEGLPDLARSIGWDPYTGVADVITVIDGREYAARWWYTERLAMVGERPKDGSYALPIPAETAYRALGKRSVGTVGTVDIFRAKEPWGEREFPFILVSSLGGIVPEDVDRSMFASHLYTARLTANCRTREA